jgi:hypothetical protein
MVGATLRMGWCHGKYRNKGQCHNKQQLPKTIKPKITHIKNLHLRHGDRDFMYRIARKLPFGGWRVGKIVLPSPSFACFQTRRASGN